MRLGMVSIASSVFGTQLYKNPVVCQFRGAEEHRKTRISGEQSNKTSHPSSQSVIIYTVQLGRYLPCLKLHEKYCHRLQLGQTRALWDFTKRRTLAYREAYIKWQQHDDKIKIAYQAYPLPKLLKVETYILFKI